MRYKRWRNEVFGQTDGSDPVRVELSREFYAVSLDEAFDHIDRALDDPDVHALYSKDQIGVGLNIIYSNGCSDLPFCYTQAADESRRVQGISKLRSLYANFFDRYCEEPVRSIGNDCGDGQIGFICYMLWDIFVLYPGTASPGMTAAALAVMAHGLQSRHDNSIVSAIHGLGHWALNVPEALHILRTWLQRPTTKNVVVIDYARQAATGNIQ